MLFRKVDAHTAHHLYHECLKGDLMRDRTVILVSHHVQLCSPGASYIVTLDNGHITYSGDADSFKSSGIMASLVQSDDAAGKAEAATDEEQEHHPEPKKIEELPSKSASMITMDSEVDDDGSPSSETSSTLAASSEVDSKVAGKKKAARKLIEEEKRAVGRIGREIWMTYFTAIGGKIYWVLFLLAIGLAAVTPALENGWLRYVPSILL